jgi:hypothetical protein
MRRSAPLPEWEAVVQQLTALGGQNGAPDVKWSSGTNASYVEHTDVLAVGRHFARRWEPSSRQAVWLLAHELGHRSVGSRNPGVQARRTALRSAPAIAPTVIGSLIAADDYATSLVGAEGVHVLAVMPEHRRLGFISPPTHPPTQDRVRRQQAANGGAGQEAER